MKSVDLNRYLVEIDIGGSKFKQIGWYVTSLVFFQNALPFPSSLKSQLLRFFGARIGRRVRFKPSLQVKYPWKLEIGDNSWIGEKVWIDNLEKVTIGKNCCLSQGAMVLTGSHDPMSSSMDYVAAPCFT
jgi:putative colanic acid biosynthesis acetyltransferase WcaF